MRREILNHIRTCCINGCCPGHDTFPNETYNSRRSKRARTRDKKVEHQLARTISKRKLRCEVESND